MMTTAVESSVLLDLLTGSLDEAARAADSLKNCVNDGPVIVCETVIAEIMPELGVDQLTKFLRSWQLDFVLSNAICAIRAGQMYAEYLRRGGRRGRVVPDFLIGAHAFTFSDRLLTRDNGFGRDYFRGLKTMSP